MKRFLSIVLALCMVLSAVVVLAKTESGQDARVAEIPDTVTIIGQGTFVGCDTLEEIVIPDSVTSMGEEAVQLCRNLKKVVIGRGMRDVPRMAFSYCSIERLVVLNKETKMYSRVQYKVNMHGAMKEYWLLDSFNSCIIGEIYAPSGSEAEKYAKEQGIPFFPIDESEYGAQNIIEKAKFIEVEPKIQGIHGGMVFRYNFVERITGIAESLGGTVMVADNDILVQKDGRNMAIIGDTVYYMDNGTMVTESLAVYGISSFIKMPEKALESVLGADSRKSQKYKMVLNSYNDEFYRLAGTVETPHGSVAEIYTGGVMHPFANNLSFVRWDGSTVIITKDAPYGTPWSEARWEKMELSEDGRILRITYPENKEKIVFTISPAVGGRVLWEEGTYIIEANLETGEVECVIKPLSSK